MYTAEDEQRAERDPSKKKVLLMPGCHILGLSSTLPNLAPKPLVCSSLSTAEINKILPRGLHPASRKGLDVSEDRHPFRSGSEQGHLDRVCSSGLDGKLQQFWPLYRVVRMSYDSQH